MAFSAGDNVYAKFFTPKEYQVELLDAAKKRNIIACVGSVSTKTFIALKLVQEICSSLRCIGTKKWVLFVADTEQNVAHYASTFKLLTNLSVMDCSCIYLPVTESVVEKLRNSQVIVGNSVKILDVLTEDCVHLEDVALLIVDDCHFSTCKTHPLRKLMEYVQRHKDLHIFGMTYPLYTNTELNPGKVEADLNVLQKIMRCTVETASDIVSIIRFNNKPAEHLIECNVYEKTQIDYVVLKEVEQTLQWIRDHRYDPSEIYDEEYLEDLRNIPDPNTDPLNVISDFVQVLETMGPWCANKAALASLFAIEKLKVKTPYERHFLTLCTVSTLMLKIRLIYDNYFSRYTEKELVYNFLSPKVERLVEILRQYKPSRRPNPSAEKDNSEENRSVANCGDKFNEMMENIPRDNCVSLTMTETYMQYKYEKMNRWRSKRRGLSKQPYVPKQKPIVDDAESVCNIIFVKNRLTATITHYLLLDLKKYDDENFWWLSPQFTTEKTADPEKEPRDAEVQHRKLEDVLRRFRTRECNVLIGTSMLEEGIDLPRCNLVIRFDLPQTFHSYVYSRSKASVPNSHYFVIFETEERKKFLSNLAQYVEIERLLLKRCEMKVDEEKAMEEANRYNDAVVPYCSTTNNGEVVVIKPSDSIACINKYCLRLPSDSFTRLTPLWVTEPVCYKNQQMYVTTLRLPINSPFKKQITGCPMPTEVLSRRVAALEMCRLLHQCGELDNSMQPIGKENFHLFFSPDEIPPDSEEQCPLDSTDARPGSNKRRQYYWKKVADCLTECLPEAGVKLYFYPIKMVLSCQIPDEQNVRGRKIQPPEDSSLGFGLLLRKKLPALCPFPVFTRCGEEIVTLRLQAEVVLNEEQIMVAENFLHYTFTKVLRLQKYYMKFNTRAKYNSYFIVPTFKSSDKEVAIDWEFLYEITRRKDDVLTFVPDYIRQHFIFKRELYADAVVMPWYRNQDMPQFFYVAEICNNLTPRSKFPGEEYRSFEEYYFRKYQLKIHSTTQPLLDVDHTSARLNFLTPRYVNRKGVALPTCSEATKKARRENLEQKQILVPELCTIHPFPASLWRKAVTLPCILYRVNSLLLAEEIRHRVSIEINLGVPRVPDDYDWPQLNFGWTLADVIKKTAELREAKVLKELGKLPLKITEISAEELEMEAETTDKVNTTKSATNTDEGKELNEDTPEEEANGEPLLEIGTWSNEMASDIHDYSPEFETNFAQAFSTIRYGSPTRWMDQNEDDDLDSFGDCSEYSDESFENPSGIRIEFKNDYLAEAHDEIEDRTSLDALDVNMCWDWDSKSEFNEDTDAQIKNFEEAVAKNVDNILSSGSILNGDTRLVLKPFEVNNEDECDINNQKLMIPWSLSPETSYSIQCAADMEHKQLVDGELIPKVSSISSSLELEFCEDFTDGTDVEMDLEQKEEFIFDYQPDLEGHVGPSPSILLQSLTMSNANDGLNLERLETIGDSFLKYAITTYLYCTYDNIHEGKLSHLRSKQVSNLNLYRLGRSKSFGEYVVANKFEPHDNWLPPCFSIPTELEKSLIQAKVQSCFINKEDLLYVWHVRSAADISLTLKSKLTESNDDNGQVTLKDISDLLTFHLFTYQTIPDKSIADCVEALIGAYLIACGIRGAMLFMSWLGIKVLPVELRTQSADETDDNGYGSGSSEEDTKVYGHLKPPGSPLLRNVPNPETELEKLLAGYDEFERAIQYRFRDRSYLLQAMTHASYSPNRITDCYQRLEFLGDAVLDYLITRHLYEDKRRHSPGALTDLRSALVNNTIFASLAIRFGFHKFFLHLSPGLADVIHRFVKIQEDNGHAIFEEYYLIGEEEGEEAEDVEVPKALGDIFESVAGAIFLDSDMSLDAVWNVYFRIMKNEIEQFSTNVPKSPIRELLELEPETAKFGRPEKLADGRRVRVTVEVFGKGSFKGIGRNYRIAKCTAAKCALKQLKKRGLLSKKAPSAINS